jgi:hypothetical protein
MTQEDALRNVALISLSFTFGCVAGSPSASQPTTPGASTGAESSPSSPPPSTAATPESIVMPDVSGLPLAEAKAKLVAAGKVGELGTAYLGMGGDDCKALGAGRVRSTSPGAGQTVGTKSPATLDVCGMP